MERHTPGGTVDAVYVGATTSTVQCRYFYLSRLNPRQPVTVVADLLKASRTFNQRHGISGALLFDGEHFGQLLEGEEQSVRALARRIEADDRHTDIDVRFDQVGEFDRTFDGWVCGWCEHDELKPIVAGSREAVQAQVDRLKALVARSEMA